jgi:hypothetical protein
MTLPSRLARFSTFLDWLSTMGMTMSPQPPTGRNSRPRKEPQTGFSLGVGATCMLRFGCVVDDVASAGALCSECE